LYFPSRYGSISLLNPASSLNLIKVFPAGIFAIEQNFDKKYIFIPIAYARELLELDKEATSVEIFVKEGSDIGRLKKEFSKDIGNRFVIKDRYEQNETLYKMMKSEKLSIYLILLFVLIIISCNLFGSLSMLIIEKEDDAETLRSLGAKDILIRRIFLFEGWMISLTGLFIGLIIGILICLAQQQFGIVKMPGNFVIDSYPVVISAWDILATIGGVGLIGYLAAKLPLIIMKKNNKIS
jgi:lipoprotein-releasing system permease protein